MICLTSLLLLQPLISYLPPSSLSPTVLPSPFFQLPPPSSLLLLPPPCSSGQASDTISCAADTGAHALAAARASARRAVRLRASGLAARRYAHHAQKWSLPPVLVAALSKTKVTCTCSNSATTQKTPSWSSQINTTQITRFVWGLGGPGTLVFKGTGKNRFWSRVPRDAKLVMRIGCIRWHVIAP